MKYRDYLPFLIFLLFCVSAGFADTDPERGDFWFCPSFDTALYGISGVSYGGGLALGYGSGMSVGMKTVWFFNSDGISVLELNFLLRFYSSGRRTFSGSFIQFMGGPALFFGNEIGDSIPPRIGAFSIGLSYGWRFLIKEKWFIEPYIRVGYPYLAGAGLSAGMHF